jgi:hypothetical protein
MKQSLAGDEKNERKSSQMPTVWQNEKLERRNLPHTCRGDPALFVQILWYAFYRAVNRILKIPFFFFLFSGQEFSS